MNFKSCKLSQPPEVTLSTIGDSRDFIHIKIGKHEDKFNYMSVVNILSSIGAIGKRGEVNMNCVMDNLVYFTNELIKLEQYIEPINQ